QKLSTEEIQVNIIHKAVGPITESDVVLASALSVMLLIVGGLSLDQWYTSVTFLSLAVILLWTVRRKSPDWLGHFFSAYLISLIPFLLVNGVLTALPVVIYNNTENLSLRLGSIPVEDTMYNMLMLLLTIGVYEALGKKVPQAKASIPSTQVHV
ncbi:MAG: lycopene cyclase domain-containing protein, partial [Bacteroidota bacterium]